MTDNTRGGPIARTVGRLLLVDLLLDKQARPTLVYTAGTLLLGTVLFHWIEGWNWLDALYFVVVSSTTIGYGDLTPVTSLGKVFTIIYGINAVAILVMLFDQIRRVRSKQVQAAAKDVQARRESLDDQGA